MTLEKFFYPKSIAVLGASNKEGKVGHTLVKKLKSFQGKKYFINAEGYNIGDIKTYRNLNEIKENIDLLIIAVPAGLVKQAVIDAAHKKIKNIIIISAGFSEIGKRYLELEILNIAKHNKINILGPNNFGLVNTKNNLDCTFSKLTPKMGSVGFVSQSGALWSAIVDYSIKNNLGFSKFISLGDMLDVDFNKTIEYLNKDKETKIIFLYIETLKDGRKFMQLIKKSKKPIVVVKGGKTSQGAAAVHSHTGSLAGEYEIYKAACRQAGAIFIENLTEALDVLKFLQMQKAPKSNKTIILTNAGGPGILLADSLTENKVELVKIPTSIKFNLPISASLKNPIDVLGDAKADRFKEVSNKLKKEKFYDILILILTPQDMTNDFLIADELVKFKKSTNKIVIACFMGPESFKESIKYLEHHNIPSFFELEKTAKLIKNLINN